MAGLSSFSEEFLRRLDAGQHENPLGADLPSYDPCIESDKNALVSTGQVASFRLGTGASIFFNALVPAILSAQSEIIFATCFWARSESLSALCNALTILAARRCAAVERHRQQEQGAATAGIAPLRVRICLSSRSLFQKLFHTQSRLGYVYPPASWAAELGLPDSALLRAGHIDFAVKSLFFLPFSVMHPKYVIVDRERAFLPSCNVSWEAWLEGCVEITGDAVAAVLDFYARVWEPFAGSEDGSAATSNEPPRVDPALAAPAKTRRPSSSINVVAPLDPERRVSTIILPSSHHCNPRFQPFPWASCPLAPATPLNIALLQLFENAIHSIYIHTPDLTSPPVLDALFDAVRRGVQVSIVTCRDIKPSEQVLTAGTLTSRCVQSLIWRYKAWRDRSQPRDSQPGQTQGGDEHLAVDVEAQTQSGQLRIAYFRARQAAPTVWASGPAISEEPTQSHLKLTIVDSEYTILGSGNMDRASWYTSQELGILFQDQELASTVKRSAEEALRLRLEVVFDSTVGV